MNNPSFSKRNQWGKERYQARQRWRALSNSSNVNRHFGRVSLLDLCFEVIAIHQLDHVKELFEACHSMDLDIQIRIISARRFCTHWLTLLSLTHCCVHSTATSTWRNRPAPCRSSIARAALLSSLSSILTLNPMKLNVRLIRIISFMTETAAYNSASPLEVATTLWPLTRSEIR